jgi:hypothetical protein
MYENSDEDKIKRYNSESDSTIDVALEAGVPSQKCYVYKLKVGGSLYIGFTIQNPKDSLAQHIESSKNGSNLKVHKELIRFGYVNDFEVLGDYENEVLGLISEISFINEYTPKLNSNSGGEGCHYEIVEFGDILYVRNKELFHRSIHRSKHKADKVKVTVKKLFDRNEAIEKSQGNWKAVLYVQDQIPLKDKSIYMKSREDALSLYKLLVQRKKLFILVNKGLVPEFNAMKVNAKRRQAEVQFSKNTGLELIGTQLSHFSILNALYAAGPFVGYPDRLAPTLNIDGSDKRRITKKLKKTLQNLPSDVPLYIVRVAPDYPEDEMISRYKSVLAKEGVKRACVIVNNYNWSAGKWLLWGYQWESNYQHTVTVLYIGLNIH